MIKTLRIQLTEECNLNCVYCCHEGTKNDFCILKNRNLESFIRASYDVLGIKRVKFTGGEPLEYDEDICGIINNVGRAGIQYSIVTNATNYDKFRELVDRFPDTEVTISLPVPANEAYLSTFKSITGAIDERAAFLSVINCIEYMLELKTDFKINYVLCRGMNTSSTYIKEIIEYAKQYPRMQLRFLETVVNSTNNQDGRMSNFIFSQADFENVLGELGYGECINNKSCDKRSSCLYDVDGCNIKFIKFFCSNGCKECPEDKTSLWLTSTGCVKECSYRSYSTCVENWQYNKIAKQLERIV